MPGHDSYHQTEFGNGKSSGPFRREKTESLRILGRSTFQAHSSLQHQGYTISVITLAPTRHVTSVPTRRKQLATKSTRRPGPVTGHIKLVVYWKPGTLAIREIHNFWKSSELLIRKLPSKRLVSDIAGEFKSHLRFRGSAFLALQATPEVLQVGEFEHTQLEAIHAERTKSRAVALPGKFFGASSPRCPWSSMCSMFSAEPCFSSVVCVPSHAGVGLSGFLNLKTARQVDQPRSGT